MRGCTNDLYISYLGVLRMTQLTQAIENLNVEAFERLIANKSAQEIQQEFNEDYETSLNPIGNCINIAIRNARLQGKFDQCMNILSQLENKGVAFIQLKNMSIIDVCLVNPQNIENAADFDSAAHKEFKSNLYEFLQRQNFSINQYVINGNFFAQQAGLPEEIKRMHEERYEQLQPFHEREVSKKTSAKTPHSLTWKAAKEVPEGTKSNIKELDETIEAASTFKKKK